MKMIVLVLILLLESIYCDDYWHAREELLSVEANNRLGAEVKLNDKEEMVNKYLQMIKNEEFSQGLKNSSGFLASQHFFDVRDEIENSKVFKVIKKIPKGGLLHVHFSAMASADVVFNLTMLDDLYICNNTGKLHFKFANGPDESCDWTLLSELRPNEELDEIIMQSINMFGYKDDRDINLVWNHFEDVFDTISPLITYKPSFESFYKQALQENFDDNIMYIEIRGILSQLYDETGEIYDTENILGLIVNMTNEFKETHPDFFGVRFIYTTSKFIDNTTLKYHLDRVLEINKAFPDLMIGFDLVGQEDTGNRLIEFVDLLKDKSINLYLHSGETNWFGLTDENLVDAILLGTKRIGHGYALSKHPKLLQLLKERHIAIEVCPISNQVLNLVGDLRNHPGATFLANNYNVVIANDDPGIWGSKGLSYDWYYAFMAFGHKDDDLRMLKQFALNSIEFSGLDTKSRELFRKQWDNSWNEFIDNMLKEIIK